MVKKKEKTIITLYYRQSCHLCEQMAAFLHKLQLEFNYEIETIDIDAEIIFCHQYDVKIPVVVYKQQVLFYHFFNEKIFRQALSNDNKN